MDVNVNSKLINERMACGNGPFGVVKFLTSKLPSRDSNTLLCRGYSVTGCDVRRRKKVLRSDSQPQRRKVIRKEKKRRVCTEGVQ